MFKQNRLTVLSMAVLLALLVAAVLPVAAFAQDDTPPPTEVPVVDVPPVEEVVPPAEIPVVDVSPTDVPAVDETVAESPVEDAAPSEDLTVPEILEQVPAETDVIVLDGSGQSVPLASVEAADAILLGDPMWCPAGKTPADGTAGGCTKSFTKFNGEDGLLWALETNPTTYFGAGTIYVESTYNATLAGDADNLIFYNDNALTDLVFQGGWDFASNSVVGTSTFDLGADNQMAFVWNAGNLTLKDINVTNSLGLIISDGFGASDVTTTTGANDITLDNVSMTNSGYAMIVTTGDVTVANSEFNNNGLPGGMGALAIITDTGDITVANSEFNNNKTLGMMAITGSGDITLENVTANGNGFGYTDVLPTSSSSDPFDMYTGGLALISGGMSVSEISAPVSSGTITLNNVTASGNFGNGVSIMSDNDASVTCGKFENNGKYGVAAYLPGTLTMDTVYLNGNASGDINVLGGTVVKKSSGCEEEGRRKNKDAGFPQVIAVTTPLTDTELPGALPNDKTFVAGMSVKLTQGGVEIEEWTAGVQVSFDIPAGMEPPFTVLSWNGTAWVEVTSAIVDGKVVFSVTGPGTFVLVSP